ncbi:hypothetical protein GQ53DRAFT_845477 [Thozetella sp. PMI_491]|nr:hypothetical protein GQ53DRAFT_845477 [Thozetella sp. PMI_491]
MSTASVENDEKREREEEEAEPRRSEFFDVLSARPTDLSDPADLPRLNYNLWDYKTKLFLVSFLLVLEMSILPIVLFYTLWFDTTLRHGILFAIITSFFGIVTGLEFALRSWRLIMPSDEYRPLGGGRWHFDFSHWTMVFGYTIMTGILIGPSIPHEPLVRPLAMPVPFFLIQLGLQLLVTGIMNSRGQAAPFRISSIPKGDRMKPMVYTLVEDIVGVDGTAGKTYRERLRERYEASWRFRVMIAQLNWFWAAGSLTAGIGSMVVLWVLSSQEIAYGVAWGAPLIFAMIWTLITLHWVRRSLRNEKLMWASRNG